MEDGFTTPKYRAHHFEYARNGRTVTYAWGEVYDLVDSTIKINWEITYGREFRYDGARERHLVRKLDPDALKNNQIVSLQDVWTDYDGDEPYLEYLVTPGNPDVVTNRKSFELGIGTFNWSDDGFGNIIPISSSAKMFHGDHLGTTRHMSTAGGTAADSSVYTAFGVLRSGTAHAYGYDGAWGYRSNLADTATSGASGDPVTDPRLGFPFLHVGHRYYDPSTGRFLQRDPIGIAGGNNVYAYVDGKATYSIDPEGLQNRAYGPKSEWYKEQQKRNEERMRQWIKRREQIKRNERYYTVQDLKDALERERRLQRDVRALMAMLGGGYGLARKSLVGLCSLVVSLVTNEGDE
jgi:RHS repeat-associated protein